MHDSFDVVIHDIDQIELQVHGQTHWLNNEEAEKLGVSLIRAAALCEPLELAVPTVMDFDTEPPF